MSPEPSSAARDEVDPDHEWRVTCDCGHERRYSNEYEARLYAAFATSGITHSHGGVVVERRDRTWKVVDRVDAVK